MDLNKKFFKFFVYYPTVLMRGQWVPVYLRRLQGSQYMEHSQLAASQITKVNNLLRYAKRTVPYYMRTLSGPMGDEIKHLRDLEKVPTVNKAQIKESPDGFLSRDKFIFITKKTTGGSTGQPLIIYKSRQAMAWELAATWRGYSWAGIDIGDRQARFWGVPFGKKDKLRANVIDFITNRKRCSAFSFGNSDMANYARKLKSFKPVYFYGYVSMLEEYAKFFEQFREKEDLDLKCIVTTSEVLTEYQRRLFEEVFSVKVFNEYGCGELGSIAHECEHGSMHVMAENMLVEILDGERRCNPGELGEIVVTELNNYAMPLIRYRTGDYASFSNTSCACGRTLPVITNIFGRAYDVLKNRQGKLFHGEFIMYIFEAAQKRDLGVNAFQVIQEDLQKFNIRVVPGKSYSSVTEKFIINKIRERFDPEADIQFEQVDKIERESSGKMRLIIGLANKI